MSAHPPREERGEDKYLWKPSSDGRFSVNSAYLFLSAGTQQQGETIWNAIWKWAVPEKIKTFMWIFAHGRTHTCRLRYQRGCAGSPHCPFACPQEEDTMHLIRDCINAKERWKSVVSPTLWNRFSTLEGEEWVLWNLKHEAGKTYTKKLSWPTLFGYICWDIWRDRCKQVFNEEIDQESVRATDSFLRATWDQDLSSRASFLSTHVGRNDVCPTRRPDFYHLETDGSVLSSGSSGCGGIIRDPEGEWNGGYVLKLTNVPPTIAELIAIIQGLQLCWNRNYKQIQVSTDSTEVVNLLMRGCSSYHPFKDIIDDARLLIARDWDVGVVHIPRENNSQADWMAKAAHDMIDNFCFYDQPPTSLLGTPTGNST